MDNNEKVVHIVWVFGIPYGLTQLEMSKLEAEWLEETKRIQSMINQAYEGDDSFDEFDKQEAKRNRIQHFHFFVRERKMVESRNEFLSRTENSAKPKGDDLGFKKGNEIKEKVKHYNGKTGKEISESS